MVQNENAHRKLGNFKLFHTLTRMIGLFTAACLLAFCLAGCGGSSANQSRDDVHSNPTKVAEKALECMLKHDIDGLLNYAVFYEDSYLYEVLSEYADECTISGQQREDYKLSDCTIVDINEFLPGALDYLEFDCIGEITRANLYTYENAETGDQIELCIVEVDNKWYVCSVDFYI